MKKKPSQINETKFVDMFNVIGKLQIAYDEELKHFMTRNMPWSIHEQKW